MNTVVCQVPAIKGLSQNKKDDIIYMCKGYVQKHTVYSTHTVHACPNSGIHVVILFSGVSAVTPAIEHKAYRHVRGLSNISSLFTRK